MASFITSSFPKPFITETFSLGNTLARAAQINFLQERNSLAKLQREDLSGQIGNRNSINDALARGDAPNTFAEQFGLAGVDAATLVGRMKTALVNADEAEQGFMLKRWRLINDVSRSIQASSDPLQAATLALKNPELAEIFPNVDLTGMSSEDILEQVQKTEELTAFTNDPKELSQVFAGQVAVGRFGVAPGTVVEETTQGGRSTGFQVLQSPQTRRRIEGEAFIEERFNPDSGVFEEISRGPRSLVQRQETGGPGAFSGTTSQKFKKREEFRASVVNTSLAIDKATDLVKLAKAEPGTIGTPGAIFSFGNNFLRTADAIFTELLPGQDLTVDFGPDDMDWSSFKDGRLRELAASNAQFRAGVFSIAFAAAVAEQGSRPSDKDVEGKIREIAGDSSDVLSFTPTISNFIRNIDSRVRKTARVGNFQQSFLDSVLPELDRSMAAFNQAVNAAPAKASKEQRLKALGF